MILMQVILDCTLRNNALQSKLWSITYNDGRSHIYGTYCTPGLL